MGVNHAFIWGKSILETNSANGLKWEHVPSLGTTVSCQDRIIVGNKVRELTGFDHVGLFVLLLSSSVLRTVPV